MQIRGIDLVGDWSEPEVRELAKILAPLPESIVEDNPNFRSIHRRPVLTDAPPSAPGHSKYEPLRGSIVVFDKGVYHGSRIDPEQFRRSVYHELAHAIVRCFPSILRDWGNSTQGDGFVDDYARTSPEEDFADTFSEFLIHQKRTFEAVPRKAAFVSVLLSHLRSFKQEKVAMHFLRGFTDELTKTAAPGIGRLSRVMRMARRGEHAAASGARGMSLGKGLAIAGGSAAGAGALGEILGARHGKKKGYEEGTSDTMDVAQRARQLGRREGVMAYHEALQARVRSAGQ